MQAIAAAARGGVVEGDLKVVVSEEPVEGGPGFFPPASFARRAIGLEISGNRGAGFDGLLVEASFFGFLRVEAVRADRNKVALGFTPLHRFKPVERFVPGGNHGVVAAARSRA